MSAAWQEEASLRQAGKNDQLYYPLRLYALRWKIETNYYEQKTFWNLGGYMLRSPKGISHLVNLLNLLYSSVKLLPYLMPELSQKQGKSTQEIRFFSRSANSAGSTFLQVRGNSQPVKNS